jgi:hypothetical protein
MVVHYGGTERIVSSVGRLYFVDAELGQHTKALECAESDGTTQRRCSDRSSILVRSVVAGQTGGETNERRPRRTRRDRRTQDCSRVGRLPRTPSIDIETKEKQ